MRRLVLAGLLVLTGGACDSGGATPPTPGAKTDAASAADVGTNTGGSGGGAGGSGGSGGAPVVDASRASDQAEATGGAAGSDAGGGADVPSSSTGISLALYSVIAKETVKRFDPIKADLNRVEMPPRFTLLANVPAGTQSVEFLIAGQRVRVDDAAPFVLNETSDAATAWDVPPGSYEVTVATYGAPGAAGQPTGRLTQTIRIAATGMDPTFVKQSDAENLAWINQNVGTVLVPKMFTSSTGHVLPYRVYTPKFVSAAVKYPLFIFLHGRAERGSDNATYRNLGMSGTNQLFVGPRSIVSPNMQNEFPSFVLVPQCANVPANELWLGSQSERAAFELIDSMLEDAALPLDPDRIYLSGLSMGGEGTWDFAARRPELFASAVPMAGLFADRSKAAVVKDIPFWIFHGGADEMNNVMFSRVMRDELRRVGARVLVYTEYPGLMHVATFMRAWSQEPELLPWMFAWRKR